MKIGSLRKSQAAYLGGNF